MDMIRRRQLEARIALAMHDLAEGKSDEIVKTENGYDWVDKDGDVIVSMIIKDEEH